jgi:DNA-binding NarL/FixJ family response regulator
MQRLANSNRVGRLSEKEKCILKLVIRGLTNKEMAATLHVSTSTIKQRMRILSLKLGVTNRTQMAVAALGKQLLTDMAAFRDA